MIPSCVMFLQTTIQESRKGTTKVNTLRAIELEIQAKWEREKTFETDAPDVSTLFYHSKRH